MKYSLLTTLLLLALIPVRMTGQPAHADEYVTVQHGTFMKNGQPYYFIGTNYWFGGILGSAGKYGNRERLIRELDHLKKIGVNNLRILVGAEGPDNEPFRVTPALQPEPGVYNEELLDGLDFLLVEMKKRGQVAVLYLNNSWDWSGGYAQYLNWNGYGSIPYPSVKPHTWQEFMSYAGRFHHCENCLRQFREHIKFILGRTNRYTGIKYTEDPVIMTWEIGNEPRAFSRESIPAFEKWIGETAALIKIMDSNHLVTTGTEGQHGCEGSMEVFERIHSDPNIDYLTMHIWPKNWAWLDIHDIPGSLQTSIENTTRYMTDHMEVARKLDKPLVLEEFGLPRDEHGYGPEESVKCRNRYYRHAFSQVLESARHRDVLAGCNFWAWAGEGRPAPGRIFWQIGDDYLGDPPQEEQGLNSVFDTDSTVSLISKYNRKLSKIIQ